MSNSRVGKYERTRVARRFGIELSTLMVLHAVASIHSRKRHTQDFETFYYQQRRRLQLVIDNDQQKVSHAKLFVTP